MQVSISPDNEKKGTNSKDEKNLVIVIVCNTHMYKSYYHTSTNFTLHKSKL